MSCRPRIALVEDSEADQFLFRKLLHSLMPDARVMVYPNTSAFRMALGLRQFDCVVLDNRLPDGSGLEMLREMRADESYSTLPAIVLTGVGDETTAVQAMKWGASDYLPKSAMDAGTLRAALDGAFAAAAREKAKQENTARLREQAQTDGLTGLFNRRAFDEAVVSLDRDAGRAGLALLYLDLDGFKPVNDRYGHAAGDTVLKTIAARLQDAVRGSDVVYRIGGDEFALILRPPPRGQHLAEIAERVVQTVGQAVCDEHGQEVYPGGGSLGVAWRDDGGEKLATLIEDADAAMYAAKQAGGGVQFASSAANRPTRYRRAE